MEVSKNLTIEMVFMQLQLLRREREVVSKAINGDVNAAIPYLYHGAIMAINSLTKTCLCEETGSPMSNFEHEISIISMGAEMMKSGMSFDDVADVISGIDEGKAAKCDGEASL